MNKLMKISFFSLFSLYLLQPAAGFGLDLGNPLDPLDLQGDGAGTSDSATLPGGVTIQVPQLPGSDGKLEIALPDVSLEDLRDCLGNLAQCPQRIKEKLTYDAIWPIVRTYKAYLYQQVRGGWHSLPASFVAAAAPHYPGLDLGAIRYAEGAPTGKGNAVTFGNDIFFPRDINFNNRSDIRWTLHELQHSVQYAQLGERGFFEKYIANSADLIINTGTVEIHDDIDFERDADAKADSILASVISALNPGGDAHEVMVEYCYDLRLAVAYEGSDHRMRTLGWWNIPANGKPTKLLYDNQPLKAFGEKLYAYAEDENGNVAIGGDMMVEVTSDDGDETVRMGLFELGNKSDQFELGTASSDPNAPGCFR